MEAERFVTRNIIHEVHSWDVPRYHMGDESGVTRGIIDELHSWDIQGDQMEAQSMVILKVS